MNIYLNLDVFNHCFIECAMNLEVDTHEMERQIMAREHVGFLNSQMERMGERRGETKKLSTQKN